jgi:hypothetical protein
MDLGPVVLLGLMWVVVNALRKAASGSSDKPRIPPGRPRPQPPRPPRPAGVRPDQTRVRTLPATTGLDATQREGMRLEALLRDLGRTLDQSAGPSGRAPDRPLPSADEVEERGSLEGIPTVRSLESTPARRAQAVVNRDDEAERVVAGRIAAAEANAAPLTAAEFKAFETRVRQEPADKTATRAYTVARLRQAVVWREILGPPVALRRDGEPGPE